MIKHKFLGHRGSYPVKAAEVYVEGQVAAIDTDGNVVKALSAGNINIIGMLGNSSVTDLINGSATVYFSQGELSIYAGDSSDITTAPFDTTKTFVPADLLYVDTAGLITNVDPADGQVGFGVVNKVEGTVADQVIYFFLRV